MGAMVAQISLRIRTTSLKQAYVILTPLNPTFIW